MFAMHIIKPEQSFNYQADPPRRLEMPPGNFRWPIAVGVTLYMLLTIVVMFAVIVVVELIATAKRRVGLQDDFEARGAWYDWMMDLMFFRLRWPPRLRRLFDSWLGMM